MRLLVPSAIVAAIFCYAPALADTTGVVHGTVVILGKPVAGVAVTLSGEGSVYRTTSTPDGRFSFIRIPYGRYELDARSTEGATFRQPLDIQSDAVIDLPIDLSLRKIGRTQTVSGRSAGSQPVSVNAIDRAQIAASPESESLNRLIETFPGIVRFSYNEPVAHGFHGLSYELDGVPLPQSTASNFSEVIDPRNIDSLEIFTGAFPAEFGGSRQGAVVNIISNRANDLSAPEEGSLTAGFGSYGELESSLGESATFGNTRVFLTANEERSNRGIDTPTYVPEHDNSNASNQFFRSITNVGLHDSIAFDASNNDAIYQIPINTEPNNPEDPITSVPGTDDVQREYDSFFTLSYTHNAANGSAYTQIAPYYKYDRIVYAGDLANDLLATTSGAPYSNAGLIQDRHSVFSGIRLTQFDSFGPNSVKAGIDADIENFSGNEDIAYFPTLANGNSSTTPATFFDTQAQRGTNFGAYIEDKWTPTSYFSTQAGVRYDHSTGYVAGAQLSPRIEINGQIDPKDILHFYYGRLYAAPFLEDTRAAAVVVGGLGNTLPTYDLKPEHDSYYEFGLAHTLTSNTRTTVNFWKRDVENVLDTTQLANTPIFAVYNNTIGIAKGVEGRVDTHWQNGDSLYFSTQLSKSVAGGISGGTFLFPPASGTDPSDVTLSAEDHDQPFSAFLGYTKRLGADHSVFATLEPEYALGYPVQFQNGSTRLPPHLTFNGSFGRDPGRGRNRKVGLRADFQNFTNTQYILKIANGFNTTQWGEGFQADIRVTAPF
jgi:outer membrane receptor protein involved in Fe transport